VGVAAVAVVAVGGENRPDVAREIDRLAGSGGAGERGDAEESGAGVVSAHGAASVKHGLRGQCCRLQSTPTVQFLGAAEAPQNHRAPTHPRRIFVPPNGPRLFHGWQSFVRV
jgi:hypothetical protein